MKNAAAMIVNILMGMVLLLILLTVKGKENRSMEIRSNLPAVVEETLQAVLEEESDLPEEQREKAKLIESLIVRVDSDSALEIKMAGKDFDKGILGMETIEKFEHPNGRNGVVSEKRIAVIDRTEE